MERTPRQGGSRQFRGKVSASMAIAKTREIFAVRRELDDASQSFFGKIFDRTLLDEVNGMGRLFLPETLSVTVVGFSRYSRKYIERGPKTKEVVAKIPNANSRIEASLGELALFGSIKKPKLAFELVSERLQTEVDDFENQFTTSDFPLKPDYNSDTGKPQMHLSIGLVYSDSLRYFSEKSVLGNIAGIVGAEGKKIILKPSSA